MLIGLSGIGDIASAQTTAATTIRPDPPPVVCVNNVCTEGSHTIKWNPGHYMASDTVLGPGDTLSKVQSEMDDINGWDQILGYRVFISWAALEPTQGAYDFTLLDAILNRLKTQYNKPKRMVVVVLPGTFSGEWSSKDASTVPMYIQTGSAYGASPVSGSYGWWGPNSNGASTGYYVAALYRQAVMDRFIALVQALGKHYDGEPYFEAFMVQEDSWMVGAWYIAPDYSASGEVTQLERLMTAATAAFPHTSVVMENTWNGSVASSMSLESWMVANRVAPGNSDTLGETAFSKYNYGASLAWGLQAYLGIANGSVTPTDLRPQARAMVDVEAPDIAGPYFSKYGGPFTPLDVVNALNQTYKASHAFWTHLVGTETVFGGSVPAAAKWSNLAATVSANPLTNTAYPANYP